MPVEATVQDKSGRFVSGLTAAEFSVFENDEPQTIDLAHRIAPSTRCSWMRATAYARKRSCVLRGRLADFLRPNDRIIVAPFAKSVGAIYGTNQRSRDHACAVQAIIGTANAMCVEASRLVPEHDRRHAIVPITDGYDEQPDLHRDALAAVAAHAW